jgi:hypothetical protein
MRIWSRYWCTQGKTTHQKTPPVVTDYIEKELIETHQNVTLYMDGIKINSIPFLTTIPRNIMYRNVFPPKGIVSPYYYSPHMLMHQQSIDYNKNCSITLDHM